LALALTLIGATLAAQTHHSGNSTTVIQQRGAGPSQSQVTTYPDGRKVITRDGQSSDISLQRGSPGTPAGSADDHDGLGERLAPSRGSERLVPRRPAAAEALGRPDAGLSRELFRQRMLERLGRREGF
jgi:hypothetical protein